MTNADLFKAIFGLYATEIWAKPEQDFLDWLNSPAQPKIICCKDCKYYKFGLCMKIGVNKSFYGFCDWAERGEQE